MKTSFLTLLLLYLLSHCQPKSEQESGQKGNFVSDLEFLQNHLDVVLLKEASGQAQVAVVPAYQGRVMTSTATGPDGYSYGWINYELIESGETIPHINPFGGEDRFWLGPEGGQFSIFFPVGAPFNLEQWQTPAPIDTEPFTIVSQNEQSVTFNHQMQLTNYSGTDLQLSVDRTINLISAEEAASLLNVDLNQIPLVAYESKNTITNTGQEAWNQSNGLLSIWILGMFKPSPSTTIVIPFRNAHDSIPIVNDEYFGKVPSARLRIDQEKRVIYFSGDGEYRSKIGLPPERATEIAGSYDADNQTLTIVQYNKPAGVTDYVNSMWEIQDQPFRGDVINSYNDGPPEPGTEPLGPFYELETSSPAAELAPGESLTHFHRTFHFEGNLEDLDRIASQLLGVGLNGIKNAF